MQKIVVGASSAGSGGGAGSRILRKSIQTILQVIRNGQFVAEKRNEMIEWKTENAITEVSSI